LITIARSMGFGTGHHASTRLCLSLLQRVPLDGAAVLDVGTGSGVLAIAAKRLGAARVVAVDHDPDALVAARENVERNRTGESVTLAHADLGEPAPAWDHAFDVLLANLTGALLVRQAATLNRFVSRAGRVILSGILADEADGVIAAFAAQGARLDTRLDEEEWVGLLLTTSPTSSTTR
jgi:ribosomal protein L11 methyltransferase